VEIILRKQLTSHVIQLLAETRHMKQDRQAGRQAGQVESRPACTCVRLHGMQLLLVVASDRMHVKERTESRR